MTTDAEHKAMAWLDGVASDRITHLRVVDGEYARTLKAMLSRPVLPEEPTPEMIGAMQRAYRLGEGSGLFSQVYRALYAHLTAPKTKTVWEVRYEGEHCWSRYYSRIEALNAVERRLSEGKHHVEIHETEVPA